MNYHKIEKTSVANGPGVRTTLWVAGCRLHCENCHNPQTWDFDSGKPFNDNAKQELFESLNKSYIQGLSLSGGHPLEPENVKTIYLLVKEIKDKFPTKDIWLYTGYTWEYIFPNVITDDFNKERMYRQEIVRMCDVVVDGPFIESQKDLTLRWCGSRNQRVIDCKQTIKNEEIVLYTE